MIYRQATLADAAALAALGGRLFVDSYEQLMDGSELQAYVRNHFNDERQAAELSDPHISTFLASEDALVGYVQLAFGNVPGCALAAAAPAELKRIYVDRQWHGHGIARELLRLAQQEAQTRNCDMLWLAVWELNPRAISFYSKNGFEIIGRQGFPLGHEIQSDYVMARRVANELR